MSSAADTASSPAAASKGGRFGIGMLLGVALFSVAGAGGAAYFVFGKSKADPAHAESHGDEAQAVPSGPATYLALDPAFVVNLESPDEPHYLQVDVQLMARDAHALDTAKVHVPVIRNSLLMLFGQQKPVDIATRAGKEKLQQVALAEVQKLLQAETGKPVVEGLYFTSFVMQ
jgi:flagellar FliL protein